MPVVDITYCYEMSRTVFSVPTFIYLLDLYDSSLWTTVAALIFTVEGEKLSVALVRFSCCHCGNQDSPIYNVAFFKTSS